MSGWLDILKRLWPVLRSALGGLARGLAATLRFAVPLLALALRRLLEVVLALLFLFWEWGWRPLAALLGQLARFRPWALVEGWIARLPPYGALLVFGLPTTLLLPLKLLALWLIATGHAILAACLFIAAKVVGTALVARIFLLTRPALMQLRWFARLYDWIVPWQEAMFARIRATWAWRYGRVLKTRVAHQVAHSWTRWRPVLAVRWDGLRARWAVLAPRLRAMGHRLIERLKALYAANSSRL